MNKEPQTSAITLLLRRAAKGDDESHSMLFRVIYGSLHQIAERQLQRERPNHTLQPTALLNEAYIQLIRIKNIDWQCRAHFYSVSSRVMRQILTDHARARLAQKRGQQHRVDLDSNVISAGDDITALLILDQALGRLEAKHARPSRVVEMKYFGGLTFEEIAETLGISSKTAKRDWDIAKVWLYNEMYGSGAARQ
jgi:RNA polymerase sigma factor (TIGR02999 family)